MRIIRFALFSALLLAVPSFAQTTSAPKARRWWVVADHVKPSMAQQYEKLTKDAITLLKQNNVKGSWFYWITLEFPGYEYLSVTPFTNWADVDSRESQYAQVTKTLGEQKIKELERGFGATIDYSSVSTAREMTDWSYLPAGKGPDEASIFFHYDFYYTMPGKDDEVEQIAKDWKAAVQAKNYPNAYRVFQVGVGNDTPLLIVEQWAKSAEEFKAHQQQLFQMLGEQGKALDARTLAVTRRFEMKEGKVRPDLSILPPPAAQ